MSSKVVIKVENISKYYRIGIKQEMHDSFVRAMFGFIKKPVKNYYKYRSLYRFDDIGSEDGTNNRAGILLALRDVSFEVKKGEVVGIIGGNGAGKSTLLKILSRITSPSRGIAEIHGRVTSLLEVGTGFHPDLTGRENIYLNATILGMRKKEVDRKFDEIVDFAGVEKFIDTPVKRYSSGMKVRLAFSVAAHMEPEILIIDEVLAVGDAEFQKKCLNKMENVGQEGRTVLFVSHHMPAVARLCNRAILMNEGALVLDGSVHEVINSYLNSGNGTTSAREWPDPSKAPGGEVARLRAVRVCAEDGGVKVDIDISEPFFIEMEYDVLKSGHVLFPYFVLWTQNEVLAFITFDMDRAWRKRPRPRGTYVSRVQIPGNLLNEGVLYVNAALEMQNPRKVQFWERNAVSFQVNDSFAEDSARGDYIGQIYGTVRPLLQWTTKVNPHEIQGRLVKK